MRKLLHIYKTYDQEKLKKDLILGIPEIDEYFRFKPSSFNIVLGHSNTGKTTIVLYLMLAYSIKHQIKWLVFSLVRMKLIL